MKKIELVRATKRPYTEDCNTSEKYRSYTDISLYTLGEKAIIGHPYNQEYSVDEFDQILLKLKNSGWAVVSEDGTEVLGLDEALEASRKILKKLKKEGKNMKDLQVERRMEMRLKDFSSDELRELQAQIKEELGRRETEKVLYTHECKNCAGYHLGKYKHWAKKLSGVDTSKTNGYAFAGEFLDVRSEHKVPAGSIVVEVCGMDFAAYRCTANGKEELARCKTNEMSNSIELLAELV